jgi:WD40 repeat protein
MRTKAQVRALTGHTHTIAALECQSVEPQILSGSHDTTLRCWDLAAGKCSTVLTNHKKSVRALCVHPVECVWLLLLCRLLSAPHTALTSRASTDDSMIFCADTRLRVAAPTTSKCGKGLRVLSCVT